METFQLEMVDPTELTAAARDFSGALDLVKALNFAADRIEVAQRDDRALKNFEVTVTRGAVTVVFGRDFTATATLTHQGVNSGDGGGMYSSRHLPYL